MSTRYSLTLNAEKLSSRFNVEVPPFYKPVYNAAPTQLLPVITTEHSEGISMFYWGATPEQAKNKTVSTRLLYTKAEDISQKNYLKKALQKNRCLIPADGFYEWKSSGKKSKIPYRVCLNTREVFSFPGLWEEYETEEGMVHTFTIINTSANKTLANMDERMPVMLTQAQEKIWLDNHSDETKLMDLMKPIQDDLIFAYTVSSRINDINNNDADLIKQAPAADQFGNLSLFD